MLQASEYKLDETTNTYSKGFIEYLKDKEKTEEVSDYYRVKVEDIVKEKTDLGKGKTKDAGDIYVIEDYEDSKKILRYYDTNDKKTDLLIIDDNGDITSANDNDDEEDIIVENGDVNITYIEDLIEFRDSVNSGTDFSGKTIVLKTNLDITNDTSYDPEDTNKEELKSKLNGGIFEPIGTESHPFNGTFIGNNYKLSNFKIMLATAADTQPMVNSSLFRYNSGTIEKVKVENISLTYNYSGNDEHQPAGIVYKNNSTGVIQNCENISATYDLRGPNAGAGIVAINDGIVKKCINRSEMKGNNSSMYAGGIVAINNGTIDECTNSGDLLQHRFAGGIAYKNNGIIKNCKNEGKLYNGYSFAGIVQENYGTVTNCENTGDIDDSAQYASGVIGLNKATDGSIVKQCVNRGKIIGRGGLTGGIIGRSETKVIIKNCNNFGRIEAYSGKCGGIIGESTGNGTEIRNCTNEGDIITKQYGVEYVGGIAGGVATSSAQSCTFDGCTNKGTIYYAGSYSAGIVGKTYNTIISNCLNEGNLMVSESATGGQCLGGIIGTSNCIQLTNCINSGEITGRGYDIGGIVGRIECGENSNINSCYNSGKITINQSSGGASNNSGIGGIVGELSFANGLTINKCYNTADIAGPYYVGGILGITEYKVICSNSYNTGDISAENSYAGGIFGQAYMIAENIFNIGDVNTINYAGGIIGLDKGYNDEKLNNIFNAGDITITSNGAVGSIAGALITYQNMTNLYYKSVEGQNAIGETRFDPSNLNQIDATGMTEANMKLSNFVTTLNTNKGTNESWKLDSSTGYPTLDFTISID